MIAVIIMSVWLVTRTKIGSLQSRLHQILLLLAVFSSLVGCSERSHPGVRFALTNMPVTLDPRYATDAASTRINRLLYQRLVDFDETLKPVPALADWQKIDPRHYRFTLRHEAHFSNGRLLVADDVKATYEDILDPQKASPHRLSLSHISAIRVHGQRQIDFFLERADILFPGRLLMGILPADLLAKNHPFNRQPIGSGRFRFQDWPDEGHLRIIRQRDDLPVEFLAVKDPTVRALKLLRGEVDMMQNDMPPELVTYLQQQDGIEVQRGRGSNFAYLGFNLEDAETAVLSLRQAVAMAIDRQAIIRHVLGGAARPAVALLPPEHWAGNPEIRMPAYDPDKARALLLMAGLVGDRRPRLIYKTSSDPFRLRLATIIQQQLADVGIEVQLRSYDWGTFYGDIKAGRFQMFSLMWVGIKLPDIFRYVFHSESVPPNGANRGRFRSPEADALIDRAESADWHQASADYRQLQALLLAELPYVPLWYEDNVLISRQDVKGYRLAIDGNLDGLNDVTRH